MEAVQTVGHGDQEVPDVPLQPVAQGRTSHAGAGGPLPRLPHPRLDRVLDVVGELVSPRAKNLIPLSGIGLWDAEIITPRSAAGPR